MLRYVIDVLRIFQQCAHLLPIVVFVKLLHFFRFPMFYFLYKSMTVCETLFHERKVARSQNEFSFKDRNAIPAYVFYFIYFFLQDYTCMFSTRDSQNHIFYFDLSYFTPFILSCTCKSR